LTHPFYVLDANTYKIILSNKKCQDFGEVNSETTCYKLTHNNNYPCNHKKHTCPLTEVTKTKKPSVTEHVHTNKNGNDRVFEVHGYPIFDKDNNVTSMIEYSLDITARKKTEEILLKDQRLKAMGEVSAGVAHDFNNTLQGIISRTEVMLSSYTDEKLINNLQKVKTSSEDAAERVRNLLLFGGKSGIQQNLTRINLNLLISETIQQIMPKIKEINEYRSIQLKIDWIPGNIDLIIGIRGELLAVFYNIIKNSIEAMPKGGIINITTKQLDEQIYITFSDNGIGMNDKTAKRMFEPFFTTKEIGQGTGIGLSGAYATIKNINGNIYVKETKPNKGTVIEILLTRAEKELEKNQTLTNSLKTTEINELCPIKILWVDDDKDIREMGKLLLEILGYNADIAPDGETAIKLLNHEEYDVLITDIGMPGMTGWKLIEEIKINHPKTKIAVISGWNHDISEEELNTDITD
jgi:signal transduction histidine kinase/CheY-like chemotaxis protein